jgi:hypothetical protein
MRFPCAVLVAAVVLSCQSSSERPPPPTCVGDCGLDPGLGSGMSPSGGGGAEGEGGSDGGTSKGVVLTGNLLVLSDDVNFVSGSQYAGITDLKTEGADGRTVTAQSSGPYPFTFTGVRVATPVWVLATPENQTADDVLPALEPVRTDMPDSQGTVSANLALVHGTTIDHVFDLATVPLTNDTSKAQIILRLVDKTSTAADPPPLAGVSVRATAEDTLYGASASFSDVATATDATGVVVLANVGGAAYPGALVSVEFSGARTGGSQVRAVTGAVTLTTIGL